MQEVAKRVVDKLLSGRFLLTLIAGSVFAYAAVHKLLEAQAISAIIISVFQAYFMRNDRKGGSQ